MARKKEVRATRRVAPKLVNVAVMAAIRTPLTYRVPDSLQLRAGQRVLVPLVTRKLAGIVLEPLARVAPGVKVREILRALDPEPFLSPELLTLGLWIAEYYLAPIGEVFRAMLPLRSETRRARLLQITEAGKRKLDELNASLLKEARSGEEAALLSYLASGQFTNSVAAVCDRRSGAHRAPLQNRSGMAVVGMPVETVRRKFSVASRDLLPRALAEGWVRVFEVERERGQRKTFTVRLAGSQPVPERQARLSPVARRILEALEQQGPADDHRALLKSARASLTTLRILHEAGLVELADGKTSRFATVNALSHRGLFCGHEPTTNQKADSSWLPELTPAQVRVLDGLTTRLDSGKFGVALLHGITASGKTEIYLRLIARCIERGRAALLLVPEIALTPAVQFQFQARFGDQVAILHSGLGETERDEEWRRAWRGEAKVVLGTRSAVFAPLSNLGVVIVDEEHEASYKQEETPRYHGRDVAVVRARLAKALVVLGSATPSLESYYNAQRGKYHRMGLEERIGGRPLAGVEIVDMRQEFRQTATQVPISRRLREEIEAQLRVDAQTMILLNRRGYSWFLLCRSCGQTQRCVNCSVSLTYHRREHRLICHYCGYSTGIPVRCPECDSEYLYYVGEGTEKIEDKLAELFPQARVERLDRDVARRVGQYQRVLSDFRQGKINILVGTQLIAKGHDFPGVTLVGVVSVDTGLGLPDFRAAERTFQLLTQAAGRAGRGDSPGRVLVQTFYPEHYAIRLAAEQNYGGFFSKEMHFRRLMHYPPVTALANVIAQDAELEQAARVAQQIGRFLATAGGESRTLKILGPSPAPLARLEGRYRIQFLLKASSRAQLNQVLRRLVDHCDQQKIPARSVMIDVDPVNIM